MKSIITLLFLVGILLVVTGYIRSNQRCPLPRIEYRFIPKTFIEEQDVPVELNKIFGKMFKDPSPWQDFLGFTDYLYSTKVSNRLGVVRAS